MGGQGILTIPHAPYQGALRRRQRQRGEDLNSLSSIRSKAASGDLSLRVKQRGSTRAPLDETKGDDRCDVGLVSLCPTTILSAAAGLLYTSTAWHQWQTSHTWLVLEQKRTDATPSATRPPVKEPEPWGERQEHNGALQDFFWVSNYRVLDALRAAFLTLHPTCATRSSCRDKERGGIHQD